MNKIKMIFVAAVLVVSVAISGCSTPVQTKPIIEQESLLQKCSVDTPIPVNFVLNENGEKVYNGKELYTVLRDWQTFYNTCAGMHNQLVDTINGLSALKEIPKK